MFPEATKPKWMQAINAGAQGLNFGVNMGKPQGSFGSLAQAAGGFGDAMRQRQQKKAQDAYGSKAQSDAVNSVVNSNPSWNQPQQAPVPESPLSGKLVTEPTLALLGDEQPEAVVPLDYRQQAKTKPGGMMGRKYYGEA